MDQSIQLVPASTKSKSKDKFLGDIADRMVAFQRRNAAATRPIDRSERSKRRVPSPILREEASARVSDDLITEPYAYAEEFQRKLRLSPDPISPQASNKPHGKVHHLPDGTLPNRRIIEPETYSESSSVAIEQKEHAPRPKASQRREHTPANRQLFDHRKDDPMRFQTAALTRPPALSKSSGDTFVSASSTSASSYAHSIGSSFTLTSNSTGTSGSSLSGLVPPREDGEGSNAFVVNLKRLYREITSLEGKLTSEDLDSVPEEEPRFTLQTRLDSSAEPVNEDRYVKLVNDHKRLADLMQKLMTLTLSPQVPTSVHSITTKYNIPTRLWGNAFHRVLESLRRASTTSTIALEHLTDMIFWAYSFYSALVEDPQVETFRSCWLEALGDLARYRMAVSTFNPAPDHFGPSARLPPPDDDRPNNDSPSPSIGVHAAQALEVEPERDQWRGTARRWYALGLSDTPGTGRLHHHLGLLSRDVEIEDLKSVYHFVKSLTVLHPFPTSRENILPLFSIENQRRRASPDSSTKDLFLLLHGMLFTHVQLDDFSRTLARFLERLSLDSSTVALEANKSHKQLEEREWIMMGVLNIASLLEYGRGGAPLKLSTGFPPKSELLEKSVTSVIKRSEESIGTEEGAGRDMEVDDQEARHQNMVDISGTRAEHEATLEDVPHTLKLAIQFTMSMLKFTLRNPTRKPTPFSRSVLNPYITIVLTYLAHSLRQQSALELLERSIPWRELATFLNTSNFSVVASEVDGGTRITQGCSPLPEDWCIRGMEWAARRTYERGFWKSDAGLGGEQPVLNLEEVGADATDGIIEDDDDDESDHRRKEKGESTKRWIRATRACAIIARSVSGFEWDKEERIWSVRGSLEEKMVQWQYEDDAANLAEERRRQPLKNISDSDMDVDDDEPEDNDTDSDELDNSDEVRLLKARRRYLRDLLRPKDVPLHKRAIPRRKHFNKAFQRMPVQVIPGYSTLVIDTNILLTLLPEVSSLVESLQWTIVIPLAAITELDGLGCNHGDLGAAALEAIDFVSSRIRSHSLSLKVQTSKGNYLSTLSVRVEDIQFKAEHDSWERSMDDLILKAAIWQTEHWVDRSKLLNRVRSQMVSESAAKVILLSLDRNLRLKARARHLDTAGEKILSTLLESSA